MKNKKNQEGEPFYEAMPATMQGMMSSDKSNMRKMLPWLAIPAAILLAKGIWSMTSDKPAMQNMKQKMKEKSEKLKNSTQNMMKRDEGQQNQPTES